jgi:hypothetical protein
MTGNVTFGHLHAASDEIIAAVHANLALLEGLDRQAIIGVTRTIPPGKPDWRCLFGVSLPHTPVIDKNDPPTLDWRCLAGVQVSIGDLVAFLQAVSDHCGIIGSVLEAADQNATLPTI